VGGSPSIVAFIHGGALDAELAALLWLTIEARVPVVVVGDRPAPADALLDALLVFRPPDARVVELAGAKEEFGWLPEAAELGWRAEAGTEPSGSREPGTRPERTILRARDLGGATPGSQAHLAIRALSVGYGMAATLVGSRLEDLFERLGSGGVGATDDELSRLGVVLTLSAAGDATRMTAAHYLRPTARDEHGHVQRLPPAVLAARDQGSDRLEHFAWGVIAELAERTGRAPRDFEREQARHAGDLDALARAGVDSSEGVAHAIAASRATTGRPA
jgi:hypothetical protein